MKLSHLTTSQLAETLCQLTPPLCRIAQDGKTLAILDDITGELSALPPLKAAAFLLERLAPLLLQEHQRDFFTVLGILTGKTTEAVLRQDTLTTLHDLMQSWDRELIAFFASAGSAAQEKS